MNNMKRKKSELEESIHADIQCEIYKYYDGEGVKYKGKEEPEDTIIDFFSYLFRIIPRTKRKVHYSREILRKSKSKIISEEHLEILKMFEKMFLEGEDMNLFLSNNIKKSRETDFLRYTWHLYHLHMSSKVVEDKNQMKNNRSDTQLLCIIDSNDVYFIDVISHPTKAEEYFNIQSLEIIIENGWMEKIGFYEIEEMVPGTLEPKITEDKDIFTLYSKCGTNISFEFREKGYCSLEPMTLARRPYVATERMIQINRVIRNLNNMQGTYMGFQLECNDNGGFEGFVKFMTPTGMKLYHIF